MITNARSVDWNRCGQAAVATVLAHFRVSPFADGAPIADDEAMDRLSASFPPDVPMGLGTSAARLRAALEHYGLEVEHLHSGWFGRGAERAVRRLRGHLGEGLPAIVCLDQGLLGGDAWSAHWAVALRAGPHHVALAARPRTSEIALDRFLRAWRCRHLPYAHNHCALLAREPRGPRPYAPCNALRSP